MTNAQEMNISGWLGPSKPDYRDYTIDSHAPKLRLLRAPTSLESLTKNLAILDQGNLGSCTAHSSGKAFRYMDSLDGIHFDLSELFQYFNSRLIGGLPTDQDTGAFNRDAMKAAANYGMAREEDHPYIISNFRNTPSQEAYTSALRHTALEYIRVENDVEQMKAVLAAGYVIVVGFTVYENYTSAIQTGIWPEASGRAIGGHSVVIDGYEPNWWKGPGSWGNTGMQGWYKYSWNFLKQNGDDFWFFKRVTADVVPVPPDPPPTPTDEEVEKAELQRLMDKYYGKVNQVDIHMDKASWFLPIRRP